MDEAGGLDPVQSGGGQARAELGPHGRLEGTLSFWRPSRGPTSQTLMGTVWIVPHGM